MAQWQVRLLRVNATIAGSIPSRGNIYLNLYFLKFIFPFLRSGVEAKRGVEFRHSTRNALRIRRIIRNGVS